MPASRDGPKLVADVQAEPAAAEEDSCAYPKLVRRGGDGLRLLLALLAWDASTRALADVEVREVRRLLCCFALGLAFAFALGMPSTSGGVLVLALVRRGSVVPS